MSSWRDSASAAVQADLDGLLNAVLRFAEQALAEHGEFFPFGAVISYGGEPGMLAAAPGGGGHRSSEDVLRSLREGMKASAGARRAVAFAADVRIPAGDAVRVELEHRDGPALVVVVPYSRGRFKKTVTFGPMSGGSGQPVIWGPA